LRRIGIESIYRSDGSESAYSNTKILAFGSPAIEFRRQWPSYVRLMPLPLYTPPSGAAAPSFVPGRRHVLATLGTHLKFEKETMAQAVRRLAVRLPECEFHFTDGDLQRGIMERDGNFTRLPFVDYQRHLSRYALVIHHGGAGIMYHTLAAGLPAIVHPIDYDQFDHAARLQHAGLAIRVDDQHDLYAAVKHALDDTELARRCAAHAGSNHADCAELLLNEVSTL
jgi:UDP:flavonoid glycosyltransferase YjiC (YdhE family)